MNWAAKKIYELRERPYQERKRILRKFVVLSILILLFCFAGLISLKKNRQSGNNGQVNGIFEPIAENLRKITELKQSFRSTNTNP